MEAVRKILRGRKTILFFDLEATQTSQEVIEIGAIAVSVDPDGKIKKRHKGFTCYVKARHPIGRIVTNLTGITQETLAKKGLIYHEAIRQFEQYASKFQKGGIVFSSYGSNDINILEQSAYANFDEGAEFVRNIRKNYLDLSAFIGAYIRSDIGNPLSLTNCLKALEADFEGTAHDALADAVNLERLYEAFVEKPDLVAAHYKNTLAKHRSLPTPIAKVMAALQEGKTVSPEDYDTFVREAMK